ncbi:MAG: flagellar hook-basal body complex protein FliE [Bacillota bacterium]|jgi:flagellar hook-basal body complex protein FliE
MTISSISATDFINTPNNTILQEQEKFSSFTDFFQQALDQVKLTEDQVQQDILNMATGEANNLHDITINIAKADLALQTFVQIRNKALDAYNEVMRITL